jgi:hypothetical protein
VKNTFQTVSLFLNNFLPFSKRFVPTSFHPISKRFAPISLCLKSPLHFAQFQSFSHLWVKKYKHPQKKEIVVQMMVKTHHSTHKNVEILFRPCLPHQHHV